MSSEKKIKCTILMLRALDPLHNTPGSENGIPRDWELNWHTWRSATSRRLDKLKPSSFALVPPSVTKQGQTEGENTVQLFWKKVQKNSLLHLLLRQHTTSIHPCETSSPDRTRTEWHLVQEWTSPCHGHVPMCSSPVSTISALVCICSSILQDMQTINQAHRGSRLILWTSWTCLHQYAWLGMIHPLLQCQQNHSLWWVERGTVQSAVQAQETWPLT